MNLKILKKTSIIWTAIWAGIVVGHGLGSTLSRADPSSVTVSGSTITGAGTLGTASNVWGGVYSTTLLFSNSGEQHVLAVDKDGVWRMDDRPVMLGHTERERLEFTEDQLHRLHVDMMEMKAHAMVVSLVGATMGLMLGVAIALVVSGRRAGRHWRRVYLWRAEQARRKAARDAGYRDGGAA